MTTVTCGVYAIVNTVNSKVYVGSSINVCRRWVEHRSKLNAGSHGNTALSNDWQKHGEDAFKMKLLEAVEAPELLLEREEFWLEHLQTHKAKRGYNVRKKVEGRDRCFGRARRKQRKSAYFGVTGAFKSRKWEAIVTINDKRRYIGRFETELEAARAYDAIASFYHQEDAQLNFPDDVVPTSLEAFKLAMKQEEGGYKGVIQIASGLRWKAKIMIAKKVYDLGTYPTPEEAARAYDTVCAHHYKEPYRLNFPEESIAPISVQVFKQRLKEQREGQASSRFVGVKRHTQCGKWAATFCLGRQTNHLGLYQTEEEAARAYDSVCLAHHGKREILNFPDTATPIPLEAFRAERITGQWRDRG